MSKSAIIVFLILAFWYTNQFVKLAYQQADDYCAIHVCDHSFPMHQ